MATVAGYERAMDKNAVIARVIAAALFLIMPLAMFLSACAQVPITGRPQLMLVGDEQATQLGAQAAQEVMAKEPVVTDTEQSRMVERIGRRIAAQVDSPYQWRFHLVGKDIPNAFALPGGYVFVYEGLFQYARNEDQVAAVVAHEIAHVLARHGAERMSVATATQLGAGLAGTALNLPPTTMQAFGIAANYGVIMPYSRAQESEADRIGLILAAQAGYPPEAAIELWRNMMQAPGAKPPAFLSTHPSDQQRIADIQKHLPEARRHFQAAGQAAR